MTKNALLVKGPKNSGMGRPPPLIRAMAERKRSFFIDVFPKTKSFWISKIYVTVIDFSALATSSWPSTEWTCWTSPTPKWWGSHRNVSFTITWMFRTDDGNDTYYVLSRLTAIFMAISVARRMRSKWELGLSSCNLRAFEWDQQCVRNVCWSIASLSLRTVIIVNRLLSRDRMLQLEWIYLTQKAYCTSQSLLPSFAI